jgi:glycosyltransferase involved in cell wall biosynthesis
MHQLNMVTFREPGYFYKFGKPFVWGPIGGLENAPFSYLPALGLKSLVYFGIKNIINYFDRIFIIKNRKVFRNNNVSLISATKGNSDLIEKYWHKKSTIISEIGKINSYKPSLLTRANNSSIVIAWNGSHIPRKNLVLLLNSLSLINIPYELNVIGDGPLNSKWKIQAQKLNLKNIIWHGQVERKKAIEIMDKCHVLCITSIYDLTSTVLIEGLSLGLPIICLNHMGFKNVVNSEIGIKIPITNTKTSIVDFKNAIEHLYNNESLRKIMAKNSLKKSHEFSWKSILLKTENVYKNLLNEK